VRLRALCVLLLAMLVAWTAPLVGLAAAGHSLSPYLDFPPRTAQAAHAPFAWTAFAALSLPALGALALLLAAIARAQPAEAAARAPGRFPWWGSLGISLIAAGWFLAWNTGQRHTFTLLWLGYILLVNALVFRRSGYSLLTHRSRWFLALFPVSAAFWWLFEHLNQFVRNWYYSGVQAGSDWDYFVQATLPFSTVLPAVAATWSWLRQVPRLEAVALPALRGHAVLAWIAVFAGAAALVSMAIRPEALYPVVWIGPLLLLAGLQRLLLGETLLEPIARGDWRPLLQPAAAGLICGFFWELWNYGSLAKWHYSIPYAQRFLVFEMPLAGYAGYLAFGVTCALVMDLVARLVERRRLYLEPA
jgi:hypothetical protein